MKSPRAFVLLSALATAAAHGQPPALRTVHSQPSWVIATPSVELFITERGGQMAPVTFYRDTSAPVRPYHISPWQDEGCSVEVGVLKALRGDWLCLPFGGNTGGYQGEQHPPHGEVAGEKWEFVGEKRANGIVTLELAFTPKARPGKVTKDLYLVDGQNVVYERDLIEGFAGPAPLGHHATLAMPDKEGAVRVSTSPFLFGMTNPTLFSDPRKGEYQSLALAARFTDLNKVPLIYKGAPDADLTRFPARYGFSDLAQLCFGPSPIAWTTATRTDEGWLWFSLRDPAVLNSTVIWTENHGRHEPPWNGRNNCLGLEDVCAYFADGLPAAAQPNVLNKAGIKTAIELSANQPTAVNYIQGVAKTPPGFGLVRAAEFAPGQVTFTDEAGLKVAIPVHYEFVRTGTL